MRGMAWVAALVCVAGCTVRSSVPVDAGRDGGRPYDAGSDAARDSGIDAAIELDGGPDIDGGPEIDAGIDAATELDGGSDAGTDAGTIADAGVDSGGDASLDGGPPAPVIDGTLGPTEWRGATVVSDTTATAWAGNELRAMRALVRDEGLYIAVDGAIAGGNAIVVYVDRARAGSAGVSLGSLTDSSGALDDALSAGFTTPPDVLPDLAWGTLDLSRTAAPSDDRMGWRDLGRGTPADLHWVTDAQSACGATSCETFLPRSSLDLGVTGARTIAIFARITNHDGTVSPNQTLPTDDPTMPRVVTQLVEITD